MKFRKSQLVFYACLSFIIGVAVASFFAVSWAILYFTVLSSIILIIFSRPKSSLLFFGLCSLFFAVGLARYQLSIPNINENHLAFYNGQKVVFQGLVAGEPEARTAQIKYKIKTESIIKEGQIQKVKGNILVNANLYPQFQFNDILEISCTLAAPRPIEDFQYDKYLARENIYSVCYRGQLKLVGHYQGNYVKSDILKIKDGVIAIVGQILPEPQSSFLGGLLWGAKKGLPKDVLENFKLTGITHIIAVSGYNITIIAVTFTNLFIGLGLSRKKAFWLIVAGIIFFVIITGSPASIVRAGIMGGVALISTTVGRATKMHNTLVVVCFLMLLFNPKVLIWDTGFQLSFLATIGLVYLSPVLARYTKRWPDFLSLKEALTTTLSAIIFTSPLILWQFGRFSVVAPLANLLILPFIPITMLVGFLSIAAGLIWLPLGQLLAWGTWVLLTYILETVRVLANFSWSSIAL